MDHCVSHAFMKKPKIGIFDSGFGGLSILRELEAVLNSFDLVYCSDNKNFPYGPREESDVIALTSDTINKLLSVQTLDILVIACNTASTVALPTLRLKYQLPIVGVVPAIKPAVKLSKSKSIGLLATPGTVTRAYTNQLIENYAVGCRVKKLGSVALVEWAEANILGVEVNEELLRQEILPLCSDDIDTVVLACTHFPLIKEDIQKIMGEGCRLVDSGEAIARRVKELLLQQGYLSEGDANLGDRIFYFTDENKKAVSFEVHLKEKFGFTYFLELGPPTTD